ncbi:trimeric intracellular cation channel family protein [Mucilaginibacter sabulilitoris]|uniref:Trimeric intracellular cation channel family protein n=1 Tax=Mucilaginibacter sabulilitoris TaxID=1173583 RepID=A0ABZ0TKP1_9SPHI|nr:trimeric intracellular cation channel family protein [Mucilaginibacter sabulilitoris]WPU92284.1 trimeric intracellular cation channel family protein [Mucilaginibacter sabulilitoris]
MLHILYIIAITAEAMTAALSAGRRDMDWVGVCIIAWVTALGGGTVRNILFNHYPMSWVEHPEYLLITAGAAILAAIIASIMTKLKKLFLYLDALGLVVFTIIGCQIAQQINLPVFIIMLSGMITGCAGGVLRDVLCNDVPLLFHKEIYASASIVTGAVYLGIEYLGASSGIAIIVACVIGLALRLLSIRYKWQMPKFVYHEEWH